MTSETTTRGCRNTTECASLGVLNKLQQQVLATLDSRALLTTPDGHSVGSMQKCARIPIVGPRSQVRDQARGLKMVPLNSLSAQQ